jgi:hypothetical protein
MRATLWLAIDAGTARAKRGPLFAMRADDEQYGVANREAMQGYGRMVNIEDRVLLFANPEAAAEHLGCDLRPVE